MAGRRELDIRVRPDDDGRLEIAPVLDAPVSEIRVHRGLTATNTPRSLLTAGAAALRSRVAVRVYNTSLENHLYVGRTRADTAAWTVYRVPPQSERVIRWDGRYLGWCRADSGLSATYEVIEEGAAGVDVEPLGE